MIEKKYPYPFDEAVTKGRDISSCREKSGELGRWVFAEKTGEGRAVNTKILIVLEPNTLTFVDSGEGVIKLSPSTIDTQNISFEGGIFNPKKGSQTIDALVDILKYISAYTGKTVSYKTTRTNKTQHLANLLVSKGFVPLGGEYILTVDSSSKPASNYNELNDTLDSKLK